MRKRIAFKLGNVEGRFFIAAALAWRNHGFVTASAPSQRGPRAMIRTLQVGPLTVATVLPR